MSKDTDRLAAAETLEEKEQLQQEISAKKQKGQAVRNGVGMFVLLGAFIWSAGHVAYLTWGPGGAAETDKTVVRFAHWQLEGGIVDAMNRACRDYEELKRDPKTGEKTVYVKQIPIPERGYDQWVRTQLIGRTAPDLIEMPGGTRWQNIIVRYFVPITERIEEPNPYNRGTKLEGLPWRETYIDNMQGGYYDSLQDYYGMPLSVFTVRCYGNRDLIAKAVAYAYPDRGVPVKPRTLAEFFMVCEAIDKYSQDQADGTLFPIAGADYIADQFYNKYWKMASWGLMEKLDTNGDGAIDMAERLEGVFSGKVTYREDENIRVGHRVLKDITRYFNPGFMSAKRDEAVLDFVQGNAAMIATGSWEAGSLLKSIGGEFDVIIFDFPIAGMDYTDEHFGPPAGSDSDRMARMEELQGRLETYSRFINKRESEAGVNAGFPFGLVKFSKNKDAAIDFMHYLTSRKVNERLNSEFSWFPAIRGAVPDDILADFEPQVEGIYNAMGMKTGDSANLAYDNLYEKYISTSEDEYPYQKFIDEFSRRFRESAFKDYQRNYENAYNRLYQSEMSLAQARARGMLAGIDPTIDPEPVEQLKAKRRAGTLTDAERTRLKKLESELSIQRNISSLLFGQARRTDSRQEEHHRIMKLKAEHGGKESQGQ